MSSSLRYDFLTTTRADAEGAFDPVARSSLAHRHRALEARFERQDGWLVPAAYPHEGAHRTAGVTDVSHIGKLEVFAHPQPEDDAIQDGVRVGPDHWVVVCRYRDLLDLQGRLDRGCDFFVDRTSAWCALLLSGPERETMLRRLSPIAEVPGRGPIGKIPGTILSRPSGYWLLFSQEFAQYGWDLAVDLAAPLDGGPIGVSAVATDEPLLSLHRPVEATL